MESAWPPYIEIVNSKAPPGEVGGYLKGVGERARRELGTWPSAESIVDRLAAALAAAADAEDEPKRKGKLRAAAEGLIGFGRDVAVEVLAKQVGG